MVDTIGHANYSDPRKADVRFRNRMQGKKNYNITFCTRLRIGKIEDRV